MSITETLCLLVVASPVPQERVATAPTAFVEVVKSGKPDALALRLSSDQPAHAVLSRKVTLEAGRNRLRFDWTRERLDEGSLRFRIANPTEMAGDAPFALAGRSKIKRLGNMLYLEIDAARGGDALLEARYLLAGIGWRVDYIAEVSRAADGSESLALAQSVEFENNAGRDLEDAKVAFDGGAVETLSLKEGERRRIELRRVEGIPLTRRHVFDPSRFGGTPGIELEFVNAATGTAGGLGQAILPAGKVRVLLRTDGTVAPVWIGEDVLPATAIGEKTKFSPGGARDVSVERAVVFQNNENERRDRWNKVVVYDQRTKVHYKVKNGTGARTALLIVETPGSLLEIATPLDGLEKTKSDRLERTVTLEAGATLEFDVEWLRRNLF